MHGPRLLGLLDEKQLSEEDDRMEFGDYLARHYPDRDPTNRYLDRIRKAFLKDSELSNALGVVIAGEALLRCF